MNEQVSVVSIYDTIAVPVHLILKGAESLRDALCVLVLSTWDFDDSASPSSSSSSSGVARAITDLVESLFELVAQRNFLKAVVNGPTEGLEFAVEYRVCLEHAPENTRNAYILRVGKSLQIPVFRRSSQWAVAKKAVISPLIEKTRAIVSDLTPILRDLKSAICSGVDSMSDAVAKLTMVPETTRFSYIFNLYHPVVAQSTTTGLCGLFDTYSSIESVQGQTEISLSSLPAVADDETLVAIRQTHVIQATLTHKIQQYAAYCCANGSVEWSQMLDEISDAMLPWLESNDNVGVMSVGRFILDWFSFTPKSDSRDGGGGGCCCWWWDMFKAICDPLGFVGKRGCSRLPVTLIFPGIDFDSVPVGQHVLVKFRDGDTHVKTWRDFCLLRNDAEGELPDIARSAAEREAFAKRVHGLMSCGPSVLSPASLLLWWCKEKGPTFRILYHFDRDVFVTCLFADATSSGHFMMQCPAPEIGEHDDEDSADVSPPVESQQRRHSLRFMWSYTGGGSRTFATTNSRERPLSSSGESVTARNLPESDLRNHLHVMSRVDRSLTPVSMLRTLISLLNLLSDLHSAGLVLSDYSAYNVLDMSMSSLNGVDMARESSVETGRSVRVSVECIKEKMPFLDSGPFERVHTRRACFLQANFVTSAASNWLRQGYLNDAYVPPPGFVLPLLEQTFVRAGSEQADIVSKLHAKMQAHFLRSVSLGCFGSRCQYLPPWALRYLVSTPMMTSLDFLGCYVRFVESNVAAKLYNRNGHFTYVLDTVLQASCEQFPGDVKQSIRQCVKSLTLISEYYMRAPMIQCFSPSCLKSLASTNADRSVEYLLFCLSNFSIENTRSTFEYSTLPSSGLGGVGDIVTAESYKFDNTGDFAYLSDDDEESSSSSSSSSSSIVDDDGLVRPTSVQQRMKRKQQGESSTTTTTTTAARRRQRIAMLPPSYCYHQKIPPRIKITQWQLENLSFFKTLSRVFLPWASPLTNTCHASIASDHTAFVKKLMASGCSTGSSGTSTTGKGGSPLIAKISHYFNSIIPTYTKELHSLIVPDYIDVDCFSSSELLKQDHARLGALQRVVQVLGERIYESLFPFSRPLDQGTAVPMLRASSRSVSPRYRGEAITVVESNDLRQSAAISSPVAAPRQQLTAQPLHPPPPPITIKKPKRPPRAPRPGLMIPDTIPCILTLADSRAKPHDVTAAGATPGPDVKVKKPRRSREKAAPPVEGAPAVQQQQQQQQQCPDQDGIFQRSSIEECEILPRGVQCLDQLLIVNMLVDYFEKHTIFFWNDDMGYYEPRAIAQACPACGNQDKCQAPVYLIALLILKCLVYFKNHRLVSEYEVLTGRWSTACKTVVNGYQLPAPVAPWLVARICLHADSYDDIFFNMTTRSACPRRHSKSSLKTSCSGGSSSSSSSKHAVIVDNDNHRHQHHHRRHHDNDDNDYEDDNNEYDQYYDEDCDNDDLDDQCREYGDSVYRGGGGGGGCQRQSRGNIELTPQQRDVVEKMASAVYLLNDEQKARVMSVLSKLSRADIISACSPCLTILNKRSQLIQGVEPKEAVRPSVSSVTTHRQLMNSMRVRLSYQWQAYFTYASNYSIEQPCLTWEEMWHEVRTFDNAVSRGFLKFQAYMPPKGEMYPRMLPLLTMETENVVCNHCMQTFIGGVCAETGNRCERRDFSDEARFFDLIRAQLQRCHSSAANQPETKYPRRIHELHVCNVCLDKYVMHIMHFFRFVANLHMLRRFMTAHPIALEKGIGAGVESVFQTDDVITCSARSAQETATLDTHVKSPPLQDSSKKRKKTALASKTAAVATATGNDVVEQQPQQLSSDTNANRSDGRCKNYNQCPFENLTGKLKLLIDSGVSIKIVTRVIGILPHYNRTFLETIKLSNGQCVDILISTAAFDSFRFPTIFSHGNSESVSLSTSLGLVIPIDYLFDFSPRAPLFAENAKNESLYMMQMWDYDAYPVPEIKLDINGLSRRLSASLSKIRTWYH